MSCCIYSHPNPEGALRYANVINKVLELALYLHDIQLVGDFMSTGHDQVLFINNAGTAGRLMINDYAKYLSILS
jgi:hypothetical protein